MHLSHVSLKLLAEMYHCANQSNGSIGSLLIIINLSRKQTSLHEQQAEVTSRVLQACQQTEYL